MVLPQTLPQTESDEERQPRPGYPERSLRAPAEKAADFLPGGGFDFKCKA